MYAHGVGLNYSNRECKSIAYPFAVLAASETLFKMHVTIIIFKTFIYCPFLQISNYEGCQQLFSCWVLTACFQPKRSCSYSHGTTWCLVLGFRVMLVAVY